ncbi:hypothetical protein ABZ656_52505 [Streptomyces sp. NPDC007095]|uniref:hypothetical protein n=1 Tax=Streptomyces sp. NPDC007095 TaxID=3154482 RepID=UPI0033F65B06
MALSPLAIDDIAQQLLACVCAVLTETAVKVDGQPGCPCVACVVPGKPAWDNCTSDCSGAQTPGQLTVNLDRLFPTSAFPAETKDVLGSRNCLPVRQAAEYVITLLRCAPTFTENGCPPSCEEQAEAARIVHVDATSVINAVMCCFPDTGGGRRGQQFMMGQLRVLGPEGQCVGVEQRVTVALPSCGCPAGDES